MSKITKIINDAIEAIAQSGEKFDSSKLDEVLDKAQNLMEFTNGIREEIEEIVSDNNCTDVTCPPKQEPFESAMHFRGRVESHEGDPEAILGDGATMRDTGTYWWRGLPVELEVSWHDGVFTINVFKAKDGKRCASWTILFRQILKKIEDSGNDNIHSALGDDYSCMFGTQVDRSDASPEYLDGFVK